MSRSASSLAFVASHRVMSSIIKVSFTFSLFNASFFLSFWLILP